MEKVRLSKLMAQYGLCSRREADAFIERGWVYVDGERITTLGTKVYPQQAITLDKKARLQQGQAVTILLHKPVGYVSGQPEKGYPAALSLIRKQSQYRPHGAGQVLRPGLCKGLAPAGRLDIDSTGLLVMTQDGRIARALVGADSNIEKEYLVRVEGRLDGKRLQLLHHGLALDSRPLKPAQVSRLNENQLKIILLEGRKRQVRRMCEQVGLNVIGLKRVRIGRVRLANLPLGYWRFLGQDEEF
ncbi:MAG: pseudouridine synthase [Acidiferrobacterales bacterium]